MRPKHEPGFLSFVPKREAKRMIADPGTVLVSGGNANLTLYQLADGKGLASFNEPELPEGATDFDDVRWVLGTVQLWESLERFTASMALPRAQPRKSRHLLDGVIDAPDLVTTGFEAQRHLLREALGLDRDPPLTTAGLAVYDRAIGGDLDDGLLRAACCVLTEAVRVEVRGEIEMEASRGFWIPWVLPEGGGERLCPAAEYVKLTIDGEHRVSLRNTFLVLTNSF